MTNGNESAFARDGRLYKNSDDQYPVKGLTKREYFAAMAMQGILSGDVGINLLNTYEGLGTSSHATLAAFATRYADALITALNAPQEAK